MGSSSPMTRRRVNVIDRRTGALAVTAFVLGVLALVMGGFGIAAVLDRKLNLFSYGGGAIGQMDQVRFARRLQIGSSSPKLVAITPGGTKVLKRGRPFDGGVGKVDELLTAVARGAQ